MNVGIIYEFFLLLIGLGNVKLVLTGKVRKINFELAKRRAEFFLTH